MIPPIHVQILEHGRMVCEANVEGKLEFGRRDVDEVARPLYEPWRKAPGVTRILIADLNEKSISRSHVVIEPVDGTHIRLTNKSKGLVQVGSKSSLPISTSRECELPVLVPIGERRIQIRSTVAPAAPELSEDEGDQVVSFIDSSLNATRNLDQARSYAATALHRAAEGTLDNEALIQWVQAILGVLQGAAGTLDFLPRAARAMVDLIGLDSGRVLAREATGWGVRAVQMAAGVPEDKSWAPSRQVINRVLAEKRTCFLQPSQKVDLESSLRDVAAVVAAPVLDHHHEVSAILYGERRGGVVARKNVSRLEGLLVEMLAGGVGVGLARVTQEERALRAQGQMEQFFTPDLARHLAEHPEALQGRDVDVTLLSCDIRGFSRICERLAAKPDETLRWLNDALGALSRCVLDEQGVLVDYVGDELMNMWGAPQSQPDHARRACRAALAMLAKVPVLNQRWQATVQEEMGVRAGVSSGPTRVGNVGSDCKFKYGALGSTTNLAARVQSAAKFFDLPLLITEATQQQLDATFPTRRLTQVRVINIDRPVALYELAAHGKPGWDTLKAAYEDALACFEKGDFRATTRILGTLLAEPLHREDGPSLVLLQRAVTALLDKPKMFSPVWELPSK
jgi:adenylate cyclase